ncbi:MAG: PSD1 domain-containing protein [Planctomycetia bacterium]|nr:PSD1 domain-containing protein [Planctomycetia bacterium]
MLLLPLLARAQQPDDKGREFFEKNVRPILFERCYKCHSQDAKEVQGGLFLDSRPGWMKGGENGQAIVPGEPDKSLVIKAVRYTDENRQMPPDGKLAAAEIARLEEWVKIGAPDPRDTDTRNLAQKKIDYDEARKYWAFQPLSRGEPPAVKNEAFCRTPIDRFVLAGMESRGLSPSGEAAPRDLLRRVYFDLIGLPPTPEEAAEFLKDPTSEAYEKLIDRLLDSPKFGERWARHWLDVSRFAESHGFEQDYDREAAYHFRDFVIRAFNQDLPYDQFVRWQLAGDEIAPDDPLAMMATGFLGAGVFPTQITKNEVEKSRYDALDDMAATTGTAMLGLTIGCARCHDHKFDPIANEDYYRLVSTFTTTVRSNIELDLQPEVYRAAKAKFDAEHAPLAEALAEHERRNPTAQSLEEWLNKKKSEGLEPAAWEYLWNGAIASAGGAKFVAQPDGSFLAAEKNADFDAYTFTAQVSSAKITAVRLDALADPSLPKSGPGRAANGNFALSDLRLTVRPVDGSKPALLITLADPLATFQQQGLPAAAIIDADPKSAWAVDPQFGKDHSVVLQVKNAPELAGPVVLEFTLKFNNNQGHAIGRPRFSISRAAQPVALDGSLGPLGTNDAIELLKQGEGKPLRELIQEGKILEKPSALVDLCRREDAKWQELRGAVQEHLKQEPKPNLTKVMVSSEGFTPIRHHTQGADFFEQTYFLRRGDPDQKGDVATQSFLRVLMRADDGEKHWQAKPPPGWRTSYRRTALANWITDTEYGAGHLLARVIVNRLWQHHFGRGIVATPNDFGVQGQKPTHPELLDWLATELIRNNWRLKPIHKLILRSAVYRQCTAANGANEKIDPQNQYLWRRDRRRLEAEAIRDSLLAVSGTLDSRMYGPGTLDEGMTRRSIYFMVKRSKLIPMMTLFDAPEPNVSVGGRPSTTIAPQALLFMNNPHVRVWSRNFAKRLAPAAEKSWGEAVRQAYQVALTRDPDETELAQAGAFLAAQAEEYHKAQKGDAKELALADFCQVLMSLNEFVYVE